MRFYRSDQMDLFASQDDPEQIEWLRELVDKLQPIERHLVSRVFFGGSSLVEACREIDIPQSRGKEVLRKALGKLREAVLKAHQVRPLLPAN